MTLLTVCPEAKSRYFLLFFPSWTQGSDLKVGKMDRELGNQNDLHRVKRDGEGIEADVNLN